MYFCKYFYCAVFLFKKLKAKSALIVAYCRTNRQICPSLSFVYECRLPLKISEPFCYVRALAHKYIKYVVPLAVQRFEVTQPLRYYDVAVYKQRKRLRGELL